MKKTLIERFLLNKLRVIKKSNKFNYIQIVNDDSISIYERDETKYNILSTLENVAFLEKKGYKRNRYYYCPDIYASSYLKKINFSSHTLPGLIEGSRLLQSMLLPYMREIRKGVFVKDIRLVLITDKCQIYHNKPKRLLDCDGVSLFNDDIKFEESAVWDLPERKYPSMNKDCDDVEFYFPFLPESVYEYHPIINADDRFVDIYGNGGFGKEYVYVHEDIKYVLPRFYFPIRDEMSNSFFHFGGEETDYKMNLIGTYRPNNDGHGVRTAVFATDDGGRNWFCKYEFGDMGEYEFSQGDKDWGTAFGNKINCECIQSDLMSESEVFAIIKRTSVVPSKNDKEPKEKFKWSSPINVKEIFWKETLTVETKNKHNLTTGNIVALQGKSENEKIVPLLNNSVSPLTGGNGILYKVNVLDAFNVELYEYVSSTTNPIACRHIHQINRVKDGWIVGTGEIYPNGWLFFIQTKEADTYSIKKAASPFNIYRLNSSEESVQRTLGAIILDDDDASIIYASDHDTLDRTPIASPTDRSFEIVRNSIGVFKGKLADIDYRNNFSVIYEAREPAYLFKQINGILVFAGQRGEFAFSLDQGESWKTYHLKDGLQFYRGTNRCYSVIGDYIFVFK